MDLEIAAGADGGPRSVGLLGQSLDLRSMATQSTLQVDQRSVNGLRVVVDGVGDAAGGPQIGHGHDDAPDQDQTEVALAEELIDAEEREDDVLLEGAGHRRPEEDVEEGVPAADAVAHGRVLALPGVRQGVEFLVRETVDVDLSDAPGQQSEMEGQNPARNPHEGGDTVEVHRTQNGDGDVDDFTEESVSVEVEQSGHYKHDALKWKQNVNARRTFFGDWVETDAEKRDEQDDDGRAAKSATRLGGGAEFAVDAVHRPAEGLPFGSGRGQVKERSVDGHRHHRDVDVRQLGRQRRGGRWRQRGGHLDEEDTGRHDGEVDEEQSQAVGGGQPADGRRLRRRQRQVDADQRHPPQQDLQTLPSGTRFALSDDHRSRSVANE